jgi:hypothetical protein
MSHTTSVSEVYIVYFFGKKTLLAHTGPPSLSRGPSIAPTLTRCGALLDLPRWAGLALILFRADTREGVEDYEEKLRPKNRRWLTML